MIRISSCSASTWEVHIACSSSESKSMSRMLWWLKIFHLQTGYLSTFVRPPLGHTAYFDKRIACQHLQQSTSTLQEYAAALRGSTHIRCRIVRPRIQLCQPHPCLPVSQRTLNFVAVIAPKLEIQLTPAPHIRTLFGESIERDWKSYSTCSTSFTTKSTGPFPSGYCTS